MKSIYNSFKIILVFILFLSWINTQIIAKEVSQSEPEDLKVYVSTLVKESFKILNDKTTSATSKTAEVKKMIGDNLDLVQMSDFVLGVHRRNLTDAEKKEFYNAFSQYIISFYTNAVKLYDGQELEVGGVVQQSDDTYLVKVLVTQNSSEKQLKINYMVHKVGKGSFKIFDVITENYSLLNNHRALFNDFLQNGGFDRLMKELHGLAASINK